MTESEGGEEWPVGQAADIAGVTALKWSAVVAGRQPAPPVTGLVLPCGPFIGTVVNGPSLRLRQFFRFRAGFFM